MWLGLTRCAGQFPRLAFQVLSRQTGLWVLYWDVGAHFEKVRNAGSGLDRVGSMLLLMLAGGVGGAVWWYIGAKRPAGTRAL